MQVRPDALAAQLAKRVPPIVWVHGDEPLLCQAACDLTRRHLRDAGFDERQVFDVDRHFKPSALQAEAQGLSLFANRKLIELRCATKPGKDLGQVLSDVAAGAGDDLRVLVQSPRLDRQATETAWFAAVDAQALVVPVFPVERGRLPQWIAERLARQGQQADAATLTLIADRVEGNLLAAHQEIQKLGLLCPPGPLDAQAVRGAVLNVARYDPGDLAAAMLAGDCERALRCLAGLRAEGEAEPLVLWALADAVRNLLRLSIAQRDGRQVAQVMRELRIYPPRDRMYEPALRAGPPSARIAPLERALTQAAIADRIIKGLERGDAWQTMAGIVIGVARGPLLAAPDPTSA